MTGSMAARRRGSFLIWPWTPRFCPERWTRGGLGALWPTWPLSSQARLIPIPVSARVPVGTHPGVWPSWGLPRKALAWSTNWPPGDRALVVVIETLQPNSWGLRALPLAMHPTSGACGL